MSDPKDQIERLAHDRHCPIGESEMSRAPGDKDRETLASLVGRPMAIQRFLGLADAISAALARVHEQGITHGAMTHAHIILEYKDILDLTGAPSAVWVSRETPQWGPGELVVEPLAYRAPEQQRPMNRTTDSRSDLYTIGIIFYQMLTGCLPFLANNPLDWAHSRIAHSDALSAPHESIPVVLCGIVMKLLEKSADRRYQTAVGLTHDLRQCANDWQLNGT